MPPLRAAVVGSGAFGRNHLRVYRELQTAYPGLVQLSALVEPDAERRSHFASTYAIPGFASVAELLSANLSLNCASVCAPTIHHGALAEELLLGGLDVLIEKPFAASLAQVDRVLELARSLHRIVAIGHLERFNPAVTATLAALRRPMFFEAHRLSIFTARSLDVDVVLDLMIHDLDIVLSLTQSPVREVRAVGLPVLSARTDIANVRVEFESGCVANFTASRVSTEQVRKLRLFQPHQYLSLDFARQELLTISVDPKVVSAIVAAGPGSAAFSAAPLLQASGSRATDDQTAAAAKHPTAGFSVSRSEIPKAEPLRLELEDFLRAVEARTQPRVPAEAGRQALALALQINQQIANHAHHAGLL
ncbi:MAG: Gfo/Idh/MocA family protein [Acidobacteriaceae bacterium]